MQAMRVCEQVDDQDAPFDVPNLGDSRSGSAGVDTAECRGVTSDAESDESSKLGRFDAAMAALLDAVQSPGALDRSIQTPGGVMPGAAFARLVAFDGLVHGWDLATSTGQAWELDDPLVAEVDEFARQAITDEMRDGDALAVQQPVADDATPIERLVAFSGRST